MAASGKTADLQIPYYLGTDKPPDLAAVTKAMADKIESTFVGASSQLLIVQDTGAPAAKAMSGDISISKSGVTQIGSGKVMTGNLAEGAVTRAKLAAEAKPVTWYASSIIAAEQESTSAAFALLPTPDEIPGVVVPAGGKMLITFGARLWCSIAEAGKAGIFIGANQLITPAGSVGSPVEVHSLAKEAWVKVVTSPSFSSGLAVSGSGTTGTDVATGQMIGGGALEVYVPAGTYNVSVKVHSESSAPVKMRERKLYVEVHGF
jgi:hypothetical protein